jgi:UDP-N-acetylmuramate--alanine ligase
MELFVYKGYNINRKITGVFTIMNIEFLFNSPEIKHFHFIGIGGISMSGIAEILLNMGYYISGSDLNSSEITKKLEGLGIKIFKEHTESNIKDPDVVIYTAAIKHNNPELVKAKKLNIPVMERAILLGLLMKQYPYGIAVSGTHGKTTTTSMIATIMLEAGLNPTVHIGGNLQSIGGTTRIGGDKYFIAEACEYCDSFLKFFPYMAVILNVEFDHADYFRDLMHVTDSFGRFAQLVPSNGYVLASVDIPNIDKILKGLSCNIITFGITKNKSLWNISNLVFDASKCAAFNLLKSGKYVTHIKLSVPGIHNVSNAVAAAAACLTLGADELSVRNALQKFTGVNRRFQYKGEKNSIKVIDDYAHHPSEIKATLKTISGMKHSRLWCIFQPHTYTRTNALFDDFTHAFDDADKIILTDIYAAREKDTGLISSENLAEKISLRNKDIVYIKTFEDIVAYLIKNVSKDDIIVTMGAGDIYKVGELYLNSPYQPLQS